MGGNELFEHGCFIKFLSYSCPLQQRIHGVMWQANGYLMSFGLCKPRKLSIKMDLRKKECNRWIKEMQRCNEWWLNRVATVSNRKSVIIFWICALYSIQFDRRSVFYSNACLFIVSRVIYSPMYQCQSRKIPS